MLKHLKMGDMVSISFDILRKRGACVSLVPLHLGRNKDGFGAGRSFLVLASSRGLGRAIARELAAAGAKVMLSGRSEAALQKAAEELRGATGAEINYQVCDLTQGEQIEALVEKTVKLYGTIHGLVNNGGGPPAGRFEDLADDHWEQAFKLNLLSYVRAILSAQAGLGPHCEHRFFLGEGAH